MILGQILKPMPIHLIPGILPASLLLMVYNAGWIQRELDLEW